MIVGGIPILLGGVGPVEISLTANALSTTDLTTYTFSGCSFGAAASNRIIAVGIVIGMAGTTSTAISSVTIGGVSASQAATVLGISSASAVNPAVRSAVWTAVVPNGTTGDIVVTMAAAVRSCAIDVYRLVNADITPYHTATFATNAASVFSAALNLIAGGAAIGVFGSHDSVTTTWTNLTEQTDRAVEGGVAASSANNLTLSTQTLTVTATTSAAATTGALALVSFAQS